MNEMFKASAIAITVALAWSASSVARAGMSDEDFSQADQNHDGYISQQEFDKFVASEGGQANAGQTGEEQEGQFSAPDVAVPPWPVNPGATAQYQPPQTGAQGYNQQEFHAPRVYMVAPFVQQWPNGPYGPAGQPILMVVPHPRLAQNENVATSGGSLQLPSFASLDTNGDGQLSQTELLAASPLMALWSQGDANHDGKIDRSEFSAFEQKPFRGGQAGAMQGASSPGGPSAGASSGAAGNETQQGGSGMSGSETREGGSSTTNP